MNTPGGDASATELEIVWTVEGATSILARFQRVLSNVEKWQRVVFSTDDLENPLVSGLSADPDRDGHSNFFEFAMGGDPWIQDQPGRPMLESRRGDGDDVFEFSFEYPTEREDDVSLFIEHSTDLIEWHRTGQPGAAVLTKPIKIEPLGEGLQRAYHRIYKGQVSVGYFRVTASPRR